MRGEDVAISVIAEGADDPSRFESLGRRVGEVEVIGTPAAATSTAATLNPLVASAKADWILVMRDAERVPEDLAAEVARSATSDPRAWGYRISIRQLYCGRPLSLRPKDAGEVRLFHRRKARLQPDGRMKVQGTVVRLDASIDVVLFDSEEKHHDALRARGSVRAGLFTRVARWLIAMIRHAPRSFRRASRRYLWVEAGWKAAAPEPGSAD